MATAASRWMWQCMRPCNRVLLILLPLLVLPASLRADTIADLKAQARRLEKKHDWLEACRLYDEILHQRRTDDDARRSYQFCLRRYQIVHRHQDRVYREALTRVDPKQALEMYEQVLDTINRAYVDPHRTSPAALFQQGIDEVRFAFEEASFCREYFPGTAQETIRAFLDKLKDWRDRKIANRAEARDQVRAVGRTAQQMGFGPRPMLLTVITLEFLSGACNALDEYTFFLTPGHFREVQGTLRGRLVSIGVDLAIVDGYLQITRVYPRSPAAEAGLQEGDHVLRIKNETSGSSGEATSGMLAEVAAEKLRGEAGTTIELEIVPRSGMMAQIVKLKRRPVIVPSVSHGFLDPILLNDDNGMMALPVGRLTISYFQETTLQEVKEALADLQSGGMKALVLDLRGNPGGLFKSAVQVAELFLPEGIIVVSQTHMALKDKRLSGPIRAESMSALLMPMVVLIDGDTASAAEVLAAALKDNGRAKLIGQTTFGKGSIQCVIPLEKPPFDKMPGGIRITVAKLLTPNWRPFSGKGIQPHIPYPPEGEGVLLEARDLLQKMIQAMRPMTE